jgi:tetratricopeptide (TPR) repeat protein
MLYWNGGELGDIVDLELMREECSVFTLLVVRFALISTLAFAGAVLILILDRRRYLLLIFLFSSMAAIVLFYFNTRYRLPSVPVLAAAAGYFAAWAVSAVSRRRWKETSAAAAVLALFFIFVAGRDVFAVNRSATWTFLGNHYMREGDDVKALEAFSEATKLDPGRIENRINLARALNSTGDREGARRQYGTAWKTDPDFPMLAVEYGYLLEELGMRGEAESLYNHAWSSGRKREMIVAAKLLSRMSDADGDREAAVYWIEKALELAPGDRELLRIREMLEGP